MDNKLNFNQRKIFKAIAEKFNDAEVLAVFKIARVSLIDSEFFDEMGARLNITDNGMQELNDKLLKFTGIRRNIA